MMVKVLSRAERRQLGTEVIAAICEDATLCAALLEALGISGGVVAAAVPPSHEADEIARQNAVLWQPIEALDCTIRVLHCCENTGITQLGQLAQMSLAELRTIKNLGKKSIGEMKTLLAMHGLRLEMKPANAPTLNWPKKPELRR